MTVLRKRRGIKKLAWAFQKENKNAQASSFNQGSFVVSLIFDLFKDSKITKNFYAESEAYSSLAINSVSDYDSNSDSDSDFSSVFMNLDICIFFILYLHSSK